MKKRGLFLFFILFISLFSTIEAAVFTVTNNGEGTGVGTLRWALNQAEASAGSDTIIFDSDMTIQPVGGTRILFFDDSGLTVDANGHEVIIDGSLMTGDPTWPIVGIWLYDSRYSGGWGRLAKNVTIKGITIQNCAYGGGLVSGGASDITFQDCKFINNGSNGLKIDGTDPSTDGSQQVTNITVSNCEAYGNDENGILVTECSGVTIENCNAYNNTNAGIWLISGASNNIIRNSEVSSNNWPGIIISGDCNDNQINSTRVFKNNGEGIKIDDSCRSNSIRSARIFENTFSGVMVTGSSKGNSVRSSYIWANQQAGIWITDNSSNTRIAGNSIGLTESGQLYGNKWSGVIVSDGAVNNYIGGSESEGNIIAGNEAEGVKVDGVSTVQNLVRFNTYYENQQGGYLNYDGANEGLSVPVIDAPLSYAAAGVYNVSGQSMPGSLVDIYISDNETDDTQGRYFMGTATADSNGNFSLDCLYEYPGKKIIAVAHDSNNNSSGFKAGVSDIIYKKAGILLYQDNRQPVAGARVELLNPDGSLRSYAVTANDGSFDFYGYNGQAKFNVVNEGCLFPPRNSTNLSAAARGEIFNFAAGAEMTLYVERKFPVALKMALSSEELSPGELIRLELEIDNKSGSDFSAPMLQINIPPALSLVESVQNNNGSLLINTDSYTSKMLTQDNLNKSLAGDTSFASSSSLLLNLEQLNALAAKKILLTFRLSGGALNGDQSISAQIYKEKGKSNEGLSPLKLRHFAVVADSFISESSVIGKVYLDKNQNNIQDEGETGISAAEIITEEGMIIYTDSKGLFSVPSIKQGRHLFFLRKSSLPGGAVPAKPSLIVNVREGSLHKVNFPVYPESMDGEIIEDNIFRSYEHLSLPEPVITLTAEKRGSSIIYSKDGNDYIRFMIDSNCRSYLQNSSFIILDSKSGENIFQKDFQRADHLDNIEWEISSTLFLNNNEKELVAYLEGQDSDGGVFRTASFNFTVTRKVLRGSNTFSSTFKSTLSEQETLSLNIPREGAIKTEINAKPLEKYQVILLNSEKQELSRQFIETNKEGAASYEMLVPFGYYQVILEDYIEDGVSSVLSQKELNISSSWFFLTALAEAESGYNDTTGKIELASDDDKFDDEIYHENRTALFLKGKIMGKYLITLSYDSKRERDNLFNYVDPDAYYPVYGDKSEIDYQALESQDKLFVMLEWDRSSVQVGSFNVDLNENSLIYYSRSLHGLKADLVSMNNDNNGEPAQRLMLFGSSPDTSSYFNRFASTGGSVYYLEKRDIIPGTEKVVIEVRDRESGLVISEEQMLSGVDYSVDYDKGRLIFSDPVAMVKRSAHLTSSSVSSGDPVYITISFEYKNDSDTELEQGGIRAEKSFGSVKLGATYVRDEVNKGNMAEIKAIDLKADLSKNLSLKAEFARTEDMQAIASGSSNGGFSFSRKGIEGAGTGDALSIELQSNLPGIFVGNLFYRNLKSGFVSQKNQSEEGIEKTGLSFNYFPQDSLSLYGEVLTEKVSDDEYILQHGFSDKDTLRLGAAFKLFDKLDLEAEWQTISEELENKTDDDLMALGAYYNFNSKTSLFLKNQWSSGDRDLDFVEGGVAVSFSDLISLSLSQASGDSGDYTQLSASVDLGEGRELYIASDNESLGSNSSFTAGYSQSYDAHTSYFTEYRFDERGGSRNALTSSGFRRRLSDKSFLTLSYEKNYSDSDDLTKEVAAASYNYAVPDKILFSSKVELREDETYKDLSQVYTENRIKWMPIKGLSLFAKADYSMSEGIDDHNEAYFKEFTFGSAFRPFNSDRLNLLAKYSYFNDMDPFERSSNDRSLLNEQAEILSIEGICDISKALELYIKYAEKESSFAAVNGGNSFENDIALYIARMNLYFTSVYGSAFEYRLKDFDSIEEEQEGFCAEIFMQPIDNFRLTLGYNFNDFSSSLVPGDEYETSGAYIRLTGTAAFDGFEFLSPFRKEYRDWRLFKEPFASDVVVKGSLDLSVAMLGSDFEWNYSNMNRFEKNWQYLYSEDKENTYNEAVYNKVEVDIDIPLAENFSFSTGFRIDSHAQTANKEITLTSDNGDTAKARLLYFGGDETTVPLAVRSSKGNAVNIGAQEVSDNKVEAFDILTAWGDIFHVSETNLNENFLPVDNLSLNYQNEKNYMKLSFLGMRDIAYSSDDPLKLSGRCDFWQPNPWLFDWKPAEYYYGNMQAYNKGVIDDSLVYYNRNSRNEFLTMLRGLQLVSEIEDFGRIEGSIASPVDRWSIFDTYDEVNNFTAALRYKNSLSFYGRNIQTGITATARYGFNDEKKDFINNVAAFDFYTEDIFGFDLTFEYASSKTETDQTSLIAADYKGAAIQLSLDKKMDFAGSEHQLSLSYTQMDENFFTAASDYRYTSIDQYWSRHVTFYEPSERVKNQAMPFRTGDGIRENRKVYSFKINSQQDDLLSNEFSLLYIEQESDSEFLECRIRDEFSWKLSDNIMLKFMALHYHLPETEAGIDPWIGTLTVVDDFAPGIERKLYKNEAIKADEDPSVSTFSSGFKWQLSSWMDMVAVYERTNNWGDMFPQLITEDTSFGNTTIDERGFQVDSPVSFLYGQSVYEQPDYSFYNIYRLKTYFYPSDPFTIELSWTKNDNKFAGGIDDNINHLFAQLSYLSRDKKIHTRINYTRSKTYDLPELVENNTLNYESHDNFFAEIRYKLSDNSIIYANYGVFAGMYDDPVSPYTVVPWALPALDTRSIFKVAYSKKF